MYLSQKKMHYSKLIKQQVRFFCSHFSAANFKPVGLQVRSSLEDETSSCASSDSSLEVSRIEVCPSLIHYFLVLVASY